MKDVVSKARSLIALAMNHTTTAEESRTVAHAAVRIIWEYQLMVSEPPPPEEEEPEAPYEVRTPAELRYLAKKRCQRLLKHLQKRALRKDYPVVSIPRLVEEGISLEKILPEESMSFSLILGQELGAMVRAGYLTSLRGPKGGYRVPETK